MTTQTPPLLIGLTGKAGHGKDTAADYLCEMYGYARESLASPIKAMVDALGIPPEYKTGDAKEREIPGLDISYRRLCQTLGTEWGRRLNPSIWIDLLNLRLHQTAPGPVVVTDIRFENEADWIRKAGGQVWHIFRPNHPNITEFRHESEHGICRHIYDQFIVNFEGDLDRLHASIDDTLHNPLQGA